MNKKYLLGGIALIIIVPIAVLAWWLLSPLLVDKTVDEELPFSTRAVVPPNMTRAEVEDAMAIMAKLTMPVEEAMPDKMMMGAVDSPGEAPTSAESGGAAAAQALSKGAFQDADRFHKGSGEATIYRGPDGEYLLRLENFQVTNGPDLHVILSPSLAPQSRDDVHQPGYVDLGSLKGNVGNQNYEIPANVDVNALSSVVIYCAPFHVVFSVASLDSVG